MSRAALRCAVVFVCLMAFAGCVAQAQTLTASSTAVNFYGQTGGSFAAQSVTFTSSGGQIGWNAGAPAYDAGAQNWLTLTCPIQGTSGACGGTTQSAVTIQVNATGAALAAGTYTATLTVLGPSNTVTITVTLCMGAGCSPPPTVTPASLSFNVALGGNQNSILTVSSGGGTTWQATANGTSNGNPWLSIAPNNGNVGGTISVGVNAAANSGSPALPAGNYTGSIVVTSNGVSTTVPVTLTVGATVSNFVVGTSNISYYGAAGTTTLISTPLSLSNSGSGALPWSSALNVSSGANPSWLTLTDCNGNNISSGSTPTSTCVVINPVYVPASGSDTGSVFFVVPNASNGPITVSISVGLYSPVAGAQLTAGTQAGNQQSYSFAANPNSTSGSVNLLIGETGGTGANWESFADTASGGNWLSVNPNAGVTPQGGVGVSLNSSVVSNLSPGTYTGQVIFSAQGIATPVPFPVTLTVSATVQPTATLAASPTSLTFTGATGSTIASQTVSVTASSTVTWSAQASTSSGGSWLSVSGGGNTPGSLTVSVNAAGLATGSYSGSIQITSPSASNTITIGVTLTITPPGTLAASPSSLTFAAASGGTSPSQTLTISNSAAGGGSIPWSATVSTNNGGSWLSISPTSGTTPGSPSVSVTPGSLPFGTYTGGIVLTSSSASNTVLVFVTLTVGNPALTITPSTLNFAGTAGGTVAPQTVTVGSTGSAAINWTAAAATQSGGNWLTISPSSGQTSSTVQVSATIGALVPGSYTGTVIFTSSDGTSSQTVTVTLVVRALSILGVGPSSIQLVAASSSSTPPTASFDVVNLGSGSMAFSVAASTQSGGNWLAVTPTSGTAPVTLTATANPSGLAVGTYLGTIVVTPATTANPLNASVTVIVSLVVGAPAIYPDGIVDAGSFAPDNSAAPGELLSLFGLNLATATNAATSLPLPTQLSGTEVLVNGTPAPLFFVSAGQINFQLPAVTGNVATIAVASGGLTSSPAAQISLVTSHPGIFPVAGGQALGQILNANSTANTPSNPATAGSTIQIFATGLGATNPPLAPGQPGSTGTFNAVVTTPTVTIGGINAQVSFAAAAPGLAGVYQVNAVVPTGLATGGFAAVQISAGGKSSNQVMLAVH
jgi:uncharacterized protein (TIGR03437 family)